MKPLIHVSFLAYFRRFALMLNLANLSAAPWPLTLLMGVTCLFFGWRLYLILVAGSWFFVVLMMEHQIVDYVSGVICGSHSLPVTLIGPVIALAAAMVAVMWARFAIFLLGGLGGAVLIYQMAPLAPNEHTRFFLTVLAFIGLGGLTVLVFKPFVIVASSLCGATMTLQGIKGALAMLASWMRLQLPSCPSLSLVAFLLLFLCGVYFQHTFCMEEDEFDERYRMQPIRGDVR